MKIMYEIIFSKNAAKFIRNLIRNITKNPLGSPYKRVKGESNLYRIRTGKYRIPYEVDKGENKIIVVKIDKRERV